jgi:oxalate decarboxylase/phosphoglucose isomerase-like protein (cupin superfamily)
MPPNMPGTFTVIRGDDLQTVLAQPTGDTALQIVDTPSGNYGAFILTYQPHVTQPGAPIIGLYHADVALIYYVIDGTGSMALGGELENAKDTGPESRPAAVAGLTAMGVLRSYSVVKYTPGTLIIIPPGVPHQLGYDNISKSDFLVLRIDPRKTIKPK